MKRKKGGFNITKVPLRLAFHPFYQHHQKSMLMNCTRYLQQNRCRKIYYSSDINVSRMFRCNTEIMLHRITKACFIQENQVNTLLTMNNNFTRKLLHKLLSSILPIFWAEGVWKTQFSKNWKSIRSQNTKFKLNHCTSHIKLYTISA